MVTIGRIIVTVTRPHTLAFIVSAAAFVTLQFTPCLATWMWKSQAWIDRYSGATYVLLWLQIYPVSILLESVPVVSVFGWWAGRRFAGRSAESRGVIEQPVTFVYVVALATVWVVSMVQPGALWKLSRLVAHNPTEFVQVPLWVICQFLVSHDWEGVFLIGALGWMVEKRIGSLGMAMTWLPLCAAILVTQLALGIQGVYGLSGVYFPLAGAAMFLVPWLRVPIPFTRRSLQFPFFVPLVLVLIVDTWFLWNSASFLLQRGDPAIYNNAVVISAHTVGALIGFGVAAYFMAKVMDNGREEENRLHAVDLRPD